MLESSIIYILTRTLPESIMVVLAGKILLDIKIDEFKVILLGLLLGIVVSVIRKLPINFGVHTILAMISYGVAFIKISDESIVKISITTIEILIALIISEAVYLPIAIGILNIPYDLLMDNTKLMGAVSTLPTLLIFILIVIMFKKVLNLRKIQI